MATGEAWNPTTNETYEVELPEDPVDQLLTQFWQVIEDELGESTASDRYDFVEWTDIIRDLARRSRQA